MTDINRKSLPKDIIEHIDQLERMRRDFVANVSHELRTPLTVIRGYLEILLQQNADTKSPQHKIFAYMHQHSLRMENLIEDLLLLSHLEIDKLEVEMNTEINIPYLLQTLKDDAANISGNKNHLIQLNTDHDLFLKGNEGELKSLFSNIIINAVKYTPAQGKIQIDWFSSQNKAIFKVTDTGIGIAKKHIPRITERFYRVDKARSRESGGTGLGLAIAKHVLLRHQAELFIESKFNVGSTFTCVFPPERTCHQFVTIHC